jgi:hypothetical protein
VARILSNCVKHSETKLNSVASSSLMSEVVNAISIEDSLCAFEKSLKQKQLRYINNTRINPSNLNPLQHHPLRALRQDKNLIIKPTHKNLGPAIMETSQYIKLVLQEHLLSKDYQELTQQEAIQKLENVKTSLKEILANNAHLLSKAKDTFFKRSLSSKHRIPLFYGLPKVHKTPFMLRPVVSTNNSSLAVFSVWLDYKLKDLLPLVHSHIKNSTTVINDLKHIQIPENALLFSADAKSMYTNIETDLGILTISEFLDSQSDKLPANFPSNMFLSILELL